LGCVLEVYDFGSTVKDGVTVFFTMDKHEKKLNFGGTGEIIGGAGRSPLSSGLFNVLDSGVL